MSNEPINAWLEKAKSAVDTMPQTKGIQVIRRVEPPRGNIILELADKIRPWLSKMFEGVRNEHGMELQPAHINGMALNVAQSIIKAQQTKKPS